jgi:uncharacterized protein
MPIPKPTKDEKQDEFISRCMGDGVMVKDYPDEKQRAAICYTQWDKRGKRSIDCFEHNCDLCIYNDRDICDQDSHFEPKVAKKEKKSKSEDDIELRTFDITELRVDQGENQKPVIKGYAAVFNVLSEDLGGFRERVAPGAFKDTIAHDDIRALFNHDPNYVLGRTKNRTLRLVEDERGLAIEIDPPDTQWSRDLQESIKRGDITQMSFGFKAIKDEWSQADKKMPIRTLIENWLRDVSPVTFPAYPQTSVKVRDYLNALSKPEEKPDGQGAPEEGYVGRLAIRRRIQDKAEDTKIKSKEN